MNLLHEQRQKERERIKAKGSQPTPTACQPEQLEESKTRKFQSTLAHYVDAREQKDQELRLKQKLKRELLVEEFKQTVQKQQEAKLLQKKALRQEDQAYALQIREQAEAYSEQVEKQRQARQLKIAQTRKWLDEQRKHRPPPGVIGPEEVQLNRGLLEKVMRESKQGLLEGVYEKFSF